MPSGFKIDWSKFDDLIKQQLPTMAICEFTKRYLPDVSEKAVGTRARKLCVKPAKHKHSESAKQAIAAAISKETPDKIAFLKTNRDKMSIVELAKALEIDTLTANRWVKKHNIKLSDVGKARARKSSTEKQLGNIPWNKGKKLPDSMLEKMAIGRQRQSGRLSIIQSTLYKVLDELQITHHKETSDLCRFGPWTFDCRIQHNQIDFLLEVQGDYIHNLPKNIPKDEAKATYICKYFPNIPIKYIWEHEFGAINRIKEKIKQWCNLEPIQTIDFDFDDVVIKQVPHEDARLFVSAFHYLEKIAGRLCYGAYLNDKLIAVSAWGAPTRIETAQRLGVSYMKCLELRRFVIHDHYHKRNFASWLLARFEKQLPSDTTVLVSFADSAVGHNGTIYSATGWTNDGETEPSYHYIDEDGYVILKKTLFNRANAMHMSEADFATTYNYIKINTPPKSRFVKWVKPK